MKKRFRHGCPTCVLVAQTGTYDVHLCLPRTGTAGFVLKSDNSRLGLQARLSWPRGHTPSALALRVGMCALQRLGLLK